MRLYVWDARSRRWRRGRTVGIAAESADEAARAALAYLRQVPAGCMGELQFRGDRIGAYCNERGMR